MKINKVTITGLDTIDEIERVKELQQEFPFCEWGILFSSSSEGKKRYPTADVVEAIIKAGIPLSAHFCGKWSRGVLEGQNFGLITALHPNFKRVQLNYNFGYNQQWSIPSLNSFLEKQKDREVILQYNKSNKSVIDSFLFSFPENISILYDASGGRGTEIKEVLPSFKGHYTGYAGGISDLNVGAICRILDAQNDNSEVWIDMESGVRTNDDLDLTKVASVLKTCSEYIQPQ